MLFSILYCVLYIKPELQQLNHAERLMAYWKLLWAAHPDLPNEWVRKLMARKEQKSERVVLGMDGVGWHPAMLMVRLPPPPHDRHQSHGMFFLPALPLSR
jgi:hypothetical protein